MFSTARYAAAATATAGVLIAALVAVPGGAAAGLAGAPAADAAGGAGGAAVVDQLRPGQMERVAGTGQEHNYADNGGDPGDGGDARDALLGRHLTIDVGPDGTLYVADRSNRNLRVVHPDGVIDTMTGAIPALEGLSAGEERPMVTVGDDGSLYASNGSVIRRMDPDSGEFTTIAGGGRAMLDDGSDGSATEAWLRATDMAVSGGTVYVAHREGTFDWRIRAIDEDGTITTVAGGGELGLRASEGQPANEARLTDATSIAADSHGNVYIAEDAAEGPQEDGTHAGVGWYIRKIGADGTISTVLGDAGSGYSGDGGPAADARIDLGIGDLALAVDAEDRLLLIDGSNGGNKVVRRIAGDGIISTIGPTWYFAQDIAIGPDGDLYLAAAGRVMAIALNDDGVAVDRSIGEAEQAEQQVPADDPWTDEDPGTVRTVVNPDSYDVVGEPSGIAVGADGTVHVVGTRDGSVVTIGPDGEIERLPTGVGTTYPLELATTDVEMGADGSVYVAVGGSVIRIYPDGAASVVSGKEEVGAYPQGTEGYDGQLAATAAMGVRRLASGADGALYLGDDEHYRVYELTGDATLRTVANTDLWYRGGLAVGPNGGVYMSQCVDAGSADGEMMVERVLTVAPGGEMDLVAELETPIGSSDDGGGCGTSTAASVATPTDVAVDDDGTAYVATSRGIQAVGDDGEVSTVLEPSDDAPGVPTNLALDPHGNLYFTESDDRVRVLVRPGESGGWAAWTWGAGAAVAVLAAATTALVLLRRRRLSTT